MKIRKARIEDFKELYRVGKSVSEMKVSIKDFKFWIKNKRSTFLLAEESGKILGFVYAITKEDPKYDVLVYLVVIPGYREKGVANALLGNCMKTIRKHI